MKAGLLRPIVLLCTGLVTLSTTAAMLAVPHKREVLASSPIHNRGTPPGSVSPKPPLPDADAFYPISIEAAEQLNRKLPFAAGPNPAAAPFFIPDRQLSDFDRALHCLAAAVYYEAAVEPVEGQQAVAQVVLNRLRHPAFPKTVCGVVFEGSERQTGCQFTFTCDGSLQRAPSADGWARARKVALAALRGAVANKVGWSTHYHADYVLPYWAPTLLKTAAIGSHIFYRWNAGWSAPGLFKAAYAGKEPVIALAGSEAAVEEGEPASLDFAGTPTDPSSQIPDAPPPPPPLLEDRKVAKLLADQGARPSFGVQTAAAGEASTRKPPRLPSAPCRNASTTRIEPFSARSGETSKVDPCA